jgi:long-chain acyl-CoA synthetase
MPQTLWDIVARQAQTRPDDVAFVARDGRLTFADVADATERAAAALYRLGIRPGDRVGASTRNGVQIVMAFLGAMRIGAVWVGLSRALAPVEKSRLLSAAGAVLYLGDDAGAPDITSTQGLRHALDFDSEWAALTALADDRAPEIAVDPFAPAAIGWTSGTSGRPKGAVHSQQGLLLPGAALGALWGPEARHGTALSLTIINPMILGPLLSLQAGATNVIMDATHASAVADWVERERVTTLMCVPTMLYDLVHEAAVLPAQLQTLHWPIVGGAHPAETVLSAYEAKFGVRPLGCYGLTEAPSVVSLAQPRDVGSSGPAAPHLTIRIVGDDDRVLCAGETGEISIGPRADGLWAGCYRPFLGYHDQPDATAAALKGDWLMTGDMGHLDASGNLFITGRRSELILRGGANIYPAEIEAVLQAMPGVAASAVIGRPDERLGETVVAFVEPATGTELTADAVHAFCAAHLAKYKIPSEVHVVNMFERTALGKINKASLRDALIPTVL